MINETLEVLKTRRSIRKFKPDQISDEELNAVTEAGTYAPTGKGSQGVQIVVVQDPETVAKLDKMNAEVLGIDTNPYYGAPTIILVFENENCKTPEMDGAAVCTNMLNAAHSIGLGSCWINRCKQMFKMEEGKELLRQWGLPENLEGVASLSLGYADCENPEAPARREGYVLRV